MHIQFSALVIGAFLGLFVHMLLGRSRQDKEAAILWVLRHADGPTYAPDLVRITGIQRGTIYIHLSHLEDEGHLKSYTESTPSPSTLGRRVYFAAPTGPQHD